MKKRTFGQDRPHHNEKSDDESYEEGKETERFSFRTSSREELSTNVVETKTHV